MHYVVLGLGCRGRGMRRDLKVGDLVLEEVMRRKEIYLVVNFRTGSYYDVCMVHLETMNLDWYSTESVSGLEILSEID